MVDFGKRLKKLRTEAGFTQADLAARLNVTKAVVSYYELQERSPSPEVLIKLANIFHVSADYLLGITQRKMIDVTDLTEEDMHLLLHTIETLRKKNEGPNK